MNIFPLTEYVYLKKKKKEENKPQRNSAITGSTLHLISYQSFTNSILKFEFNLNAYTILSYFHLFDLDCENRATANICVYQYLLPHHHLLGVELLLSEQCFKSTFLSSELSSPPRSWQAGRSWGAWRDVLIYLLLLHKEENVEKRRGVGIKNLAFSIELCNST